MPTFPDRGYYLLVDRKYNCGITSVYPMPAEKEQEDRRVTFEHPLPAKMMAIDGTWRRACTLKEVSNVEATLQVETSIEGLTLNEFFLLLSSTGLAYRRCQLERVNGEELRVSFIREKVKAKKFSGTS
ncbi:hypothetical protein M2189_007640 [Bradyrhizobium japonicum]|uniref:hypothetical protein n=1 Tax=Bradyrhizobium japonicum TaxID=375 RepID=UPI002167DF4B|nr:hypothetical protein [Bradyrhizobium japonicum]MCS3502847.1 hypothetical protein [Bradyrhizobium japonicum]MCS3964437.1 hypothetical protein [Bradyrhizobium japonicum]MCS3996747.1 hypothetical protein [Bradyrhizobium japonicum]